VSSGLARVVWCLIIESGIWGDCSSTAIGGWIGDRLAVVSPRRSGRGDDRRDEGKEEQEQRPMVEEAGLITRSFNMRWVVA
jgi:hypothetical protein